MVNPQWREGDDPLNALSRKDGFLGAIGSFIGGNGGMKKELKEDMGFIDVFILQEFICRGWNISAQMSYPHGWTISYEKQPDDWKPLISGMKIRPTYSDVEEEMDKQKIEKKSIFEDGPMQWP